MSFFVDDNEFQESTEFKCMDDPMQRAFRRAVERAIQYARNQGVTPVAALGNSDEDLAHPSEPNENNCEVVPAETQGVIGTMSLGRKREGRLLELRHGRDRRLGAWRQRHDRRLHEDGALDLPGGAYVCIQGTSMASPHAAGRGGADRQPVRHGGFGR